MRWLLKTTLLLVMIILGCVPEPSDPVAFGSICSPETETCRADAIVYRDSVGRNQIDYTVENLGANTAFVSLSATIPDSTETSEAIVSSEHQIPPGGNVGNRWTPQQLGVHTPLQLAMQCPDCAARVDFVMTSIPLECITDDDCSSSWFCDAVIPGRCVECRSDSDCTVDQRCELSNGRCNPPAASGSCAVGDVGLPLALALFLVLLFRRRRELALGFLFIVPFHADAAPPVASISAGAGTQVLLGSIGEDADFGLTLQVAQELRWQYAGASALVGAAYFLTDQKAPPYSKGLQTYFFRIGPRGFIPVGPFEIPIIVDYVRLGLASNSLVQVTGIQTGYHGMALGSGVRFRWSGLEFRVEADWQPYIDLPGSLMGVQFSIALAPR